MFANAPVVVVCPGIVLNELDLYELFSMLLFTRSLILYSQKNRPDLGRLARNATDWMMHEVTRKDLVQPIVKGQAQRETCRPAGNWKVRQKGEVSSRCPPVIRRRLTNDTPCMVCLDTLE